MTFQPVVSASLLIALGLVLVAIRMAALYRVLVRTGAGRYRTVVLRWSGLTLAVVLLFVAALRPGFESGATDADAGQQPVRVGTANMNVFFVVDRSVNSRAEDYGEGQTRMAGIRSDISALVDEYPRARFTLLSFASQAAVDWPLSDDVWSFKPMVDGLSPYILVSGEAIHEADSGAAAQILRENLERATALHPNSKNVVFYLGEGAGGSGADQTRFELPDDAIAGGAVLGYGSAQGAPVPRGWVDGNLVYMHDPQTDQPLHSTPDQARLEGIAEQLGVPYFHREHGQAIAAAVPSVESPLSADEDDVLVATKLIDRTELYWIFTLLAAALVLVEIYLTVFEFRRNRIARRLG